MDIANNWNEYELIDMANGEKLEKWKDIILIRPDPQIIWKNKSKPTVWENANAIYKRSKQVEDLGSIRLNCLQFGKLNIEI